MLEIAIFWSLLKFQNKSIDQSIRGACYESTRLVMIQRIICLLM